jgi:hypothetical protein
MATLREYFDTDFNKVLSWHKDWEMKDAAGNLIEKVVARIHLDFDANAKYWSFFIPNHSIFKSFIDAIFASKELYNCTLSIDQSDPYVASGFADYSEQAESVDLQFTKRVFLYIDDKTDNDYKKQVAEIGKSKGLFVLTRDQEYAMKRAELEKPLAFISHDTRDKDNIVRGLAIELSRLMCPVWYNEYLSKKTMGKTKRFDRIKFVEKTINTAIKNLNKKRKEILFPLEPMSYHIISDGGKNMLADSSGQNIIPRWSHVFKSTTNAHSAIDKWDKLS